MSTKDEAPATIADQFDQLPVAKSEASSKDIEMYAQAQAD